jgi:hypothetical protein
MGRALEASSDMNTHHLNPHDIKKVPEPIVSKLATVRQGVFSRFPLLFTLMGSFGLVATFYGFERLIDRIDILANNPYILLGVGLLTLIFTGTLYKKLG